MGSARVPRAWSRCLAAMNFSSRPNNRRREEVAADQGIAEEEVLKKR